MARKGVVVLSVGFLVMVVFSLLFGYAFTQNELQSELGIEMSGEYDGFQSLNTLNTIILKEDRRIEDDLNSYFKSSGSEREDVREEVEEWIEEVAETKNEDYYIWIDGTNIEVGDSDVSSVTHTAYVETYEKPVQINIRANRAIE